MPCGCFAALRIGRGLYGENRFFFCGKSGMFLSCSWFFACPAGATAQPLAAGRLLAAMPLRDSWCPAGASPPYGWGVPPAGKTAFSFVGERGVFYLTVGFLPTRLGAKTTFSFDSKEKAVLDSEKEKVDRWKLWGGTIQPDVGFVLLWCPSGKILWGIPFVSGGLGLSDPWVLLRHCR